ncbi:hypothetical protein [Halobacillus sp. B29]|uniref:hypothetical protein n=1 Tax=Halobacillus sp. B29 TaxID=3457432 RepID=UPI003FCCB98F
MKRNLVITQVIIVTIMMAIIVIVNVQNEYPYVAVNTLAVIGLVVALIQAYIQRQLKKSDD